MCINAKIYRIKTSVLLVKTDIYREIYKMESNSVICIFEFTFQISSFVSDSLCLLELNYDMLQSMNFCK